MLGLLLSLILFMSAASVAHLMGDPRVAPLLQAVSLCFGIEGFGLTFLILLKRDLDFRKTSVMSSFALLVGAVVTLVLALMHWGVWSLAVGALATAIARTGLAVKCGRRQHPMKARLRLGELGDFLRFGLFQAAQTLVVRVSERFDQIILGILSGATGVGLYSVAYSISSIPVVHALPVLAMPVVSALARAARGSDAQLARGYLLAMEVAMTINAAISFGLVVVAPNLVAVVLGDRWLDIIPLVQLLCIATLWHAFYSLSGSLMIAKGVPGLGLAWRLSLTLVLAICGYLAAKMGGATWLAATLAMVLFSAVLPFTSS